MKNEKKKPAMRANVGRGKVALPDPARLTPEQLIRARAAHAVKHNDAFRATMAAKDAEIAKLKSERHESDLQWIALTRAHMADLDKTKTNQLVHTVLTGSRRAKRAGETYKVYEAIDSFIAEHAPVAPGKSERAEAMRTGTDPKPGTRVPLAKPGTPRTFEEIVKEREAYRKRLAELGLQDPTMFAGAGRTGG